MLEIDRVGDQTIREKVDNGDGDQHYEAYASERKRQTREEKNGKKQRRKKTEINTRREQGRRRERKYT